MEIEILLNIIESLAIIFASTAAVLGINAWRKEAKWNRRSQLAEEILYNLYDAKNRMTIIRHPISYSSEGLTRPKRKNEKPNEEQTKNYAYVTIERFNNESEPFLNLEKLKLRCMVLFGKEKCKPIDEILEIKNEVLSAANSWARRTLHYDDLISRQILDTDFSDELNRTNREIELFSSIIWENYFEEDSIQNRLNTTTKNMEKILFKVIH